MIVEGVFRCGQAPESKMVRVCQGDFSGPEAVEATKALASLLVETLTA